MDEIFSKSVDDNENSESENSESENSESENSESENSESENSESENSESNIENNEKEIKDDIDQNNSDIKNITFNTSLNNTYDNKEDKEEKDIEKDKEEKDIEKDKEEKYIEKDKDDNQIHENIENIDGNTMMDTNNATVENNNIINNDNEDDKGDKGDKEDNENKEKDIEKVQSYEYEIDDLDKDNEENILYKEIVIEKKNQDDIIKKTSLSEFNKNAKINTQKYNKLIDTSINTTKTKVIKLGDDNQIHENIENIDGNTMVDTNNVTVENNNIINNENDIKNKIDDNIQDGNKGNESEYIDSKEENNGNRDDRYDDWTNEIYDDILDMHNTYRDSNKRRDHTKHKVKKRVIKVKRNPNRFNFF